MKHVSNLPPNIFVTIYGLKQIKYVKKSKIMLSFYEVKMKRVSNLPLWFLCFAYGKEHMYKIPVFVCCQTI